MFFDGWYPLLRVLIVTLLAYPALIVILRVSGKRTLSKLSAFDFVVTVALGSTLATVILSSDVALLEGVLAFAMLAGLQYVSTFISVRSSRFESLLKAEPSLLFYRGQCLHAVMKRVRITETEILAAVRNKGLSSLDVEAVVLETDGTLSVIKNLETEDSISALANVQPANAEERVS